MRITFSASLLCLTAFVAPACGGDEPSGSLIVPFVIGADVPCSTVGVTEVTVQLTSRPQDGGEPQTFEETVACDDKQAVFASLDAGRYDVVAKGVDAEGVVVVDNGGKDPVDTAEVTSGAENTADTVSMSTTPATVEVRWSIGGGFVQCSSIPTTEFRVSLFEDGGANQLHSHTFKCDDMGDAMGYHLVLDEGRDIKGDQLELIKIEPLDAKGVVNGMAASFTITPPGNGRTLKVSTNVTCAADVCDVVCANAMCLPD